MIEVILGFTLGYAVPMFLLKPCIASKRRQVEAPLRSTEHRKAEPGPTPGSLRPVAAARR
jgi:hypothetical protein